MSSLLESISVDERLKAYGITDATSAACQEIGQLLNDDFHGFATLFWEAFRASGSTTISGPTLERAIQRSADYNVKKFGMAINAEWMELCASEGDLVHASKVPPYSAAGAICIANQAAIKRILDLTDHSSHGQALVGYFQQISMVELELMLTRTQILKDKEARARVAEQSELFRRQISSVVEHASGQSRTAREQSGQAAAETRG
ncbi:MAG: hypothetical protein WA979_02620, partial [Pacificimonas sp.]